MKTKSGRRAVKQDCTRPRRVRGCWPDNEASCASLHTREQICWASVSVLLCRNSTQVEKQTEKDRKQQFEARGAEAYGGQSASVSSDHPCWKSVGCTSSEGREEEAKRAQGDDDFCTAQSRFS